MGVQEFSIPQDVHLLGMRDTNVRLEYPKNGRLLLGTTTNVQQSGSLSLRDLVCPMEISVVCHDLAVPRKFIDCLRCRSLDHPDRVRPFALFFNRTVGMNNEWKFIGRTETIYYDECHRFTTRLKVDLRSSVVLGQEIRVEIYSQLNQSRRIEDQLFLGVARCSLEDIITEHRIRREIPLVSPRLPNPGSVVLSADVVKPSAKLRSFCIKLSVSSKVKGRHRLFYVLSRKMYGGDYAAVYRSEVIGGKDGRFLAFCRDTQQVPVDKVMRLELFQYSSRTPHIPLGFVQTSVENLKALERKDDLPWWPLTDGDGSKVMHVGRVMLFDSIIQSRKLEFNVRVTM